MIVLLWKYYPSYKWCLKIGLSLHLNTWVWNVRYEVRQTRCRSYSPAFSQNSVSPRYLKFHVSYHWVNYCISQYPVKYFKILCFLELTIKAHNRDWILCIHFYLWIWFFPRETDFYSYPHSKHTHSHHQVVIWLKWLKEFSQ